MGDERFRLFCALQLPDAAVERLVAWQAEHLPGAERAPVVRVVPAANLHVTLAFLGSRPAADVPRIAGELAEASLGSGRIELRPDRYRESWLPHVTVLRFRQRPRLEPPVAGLEPIGDVRCALYRSALGPDGARYDVLESVGLGGR